MNTKITFGIGGIVVGLLLGTFVVPTMFHGFKNNGRMMGNIQTGGAVERHFIEQMIPHHEGAVDMAELALQKSQRPEIKNLATAIIRDQTKEINDMTLWYKDWFGKEIPKIPSHMLDGGMMSQSGMHMGGKEDMALLQNAVDFDKAFLETMIPHHQLALMMVQMLESGSNRLEMLQLAENITKSQSREIQEMQGWYTEWYK